MAKADNLRSHPGSPPAGADASRWLEDRLRCPSGLARVTVNGPLSVQPGFFRMGNNLTCFGRSTAALLASSPNGHLEDLARHVEIGSDSVRLPIDPAEVTSNFQMELYERKSRSLNSDGWATRMMQRAYYLLRPALTTGMRKPLQRAFLLGWRDLSFPAWPVDCSVERLFTSVLGSVLEVTGKLPMIWYWPEGKEAAVVMTHDVETASGRDFCAKLMDLDASFDLKASFQIVPEERYEFPASLLEEIRGRGFEINVQDLNHDGLLFSDREEFRRRAARINEYMRKFQCQGFRAAVMYRRPEWLRELDISYDMSSPTVAHLDPQRGGCCTVMPFFIGKILELPLTTTQDYSLFQILSDYSIDLWKKQIAGILEWHGFVSLAIHPDYVMEEKTLDVYRQLLRYLAELRSQRNLWQALPGEVNEWWRQRSQMQLVKRGDSWEIEGPGRERACLAWAQLDGDRVVYEIEKPRGSTPGKDGK